MDVGRRDENRIRNVWVDIVLLFEYTGIKEEESI